MTPALPGIISYRVNPESTAAAEPVVHIRADRGNWDFHNLVRAPIQELVQFKELIRNTVVRDIKVRYKRSVLGIAWTIIAPLMQMIVMWTVFTKAFQVSMPNYALYLFSGIITWNLFSQSSVAGGASILGAAGLITKIKLPRVLFPLTAVINNLVNFSFAFAALLLLMVVTRAPFHWTMLSVPFMLLPLILFCMGWAMLVSALSVFFRDLQYILEIALGALFYATPIFWDPTALPAKWHWVASVNPLAKYVFMMKASIYHGVLPNFSTYAIATFTGLAMFVIGWIVFQRLQRKFIYWI